MLFNDDIIFYYYTHKDKLMLCGGGSVLKEEKRSEVTSVHRDGERGAIVKWPVKDLIHERERPLASNRSSALGRPDYDTIRTKKARALGATLSNFDF